MNGNFGRHNSRSAYKFMKRIIAELQPRTIFYRNVCGILVGDMEQIKIQFTQYFEESLYATI